MIDCVVNEVPFPAYETFEDRQNLPRRFFLYFDKIYKAGRHNKDLWSAAVTRKKGKNDIAFGTPVFEAHLQTTIQENYFPWICQALANPKVIQDLDLAADFKTEYDYDELPEKLACNCPLISDLPLSSEYRYNTTTKAFQTISIRRTPEDEISSLRLAERGRLQELVDENKVERIATLTQLREMVDQIRPEYMKYNRDQKNKFNLAVKSRFRKFLDPDDKDNDDDGGDGDGGNQSTSVTPPPSKKQKRQSPQQNKCRVSKEKLNAFKVEMEHITRETLVGLVPAWETFYKGTIRKLTKKKTQDSETLRPADFLMGLGALVDVPTWKRNEHTSSPSNVDDATSDESDDDDESAPLPHAIRMVPA